MRLAAVIAGLSLASIVAADGPPRQPSPPPNPQPPSPSAQVSDPGPPTRVELNLLGRTDAAAGESRRNENVTFNLIDNNTLKELNVRLGTTATIVEEFRADRGYFGVEFGNQPRPPLHLSPVRDAALHGTLYEWHHNSIFSARSFFQAGNVKPARENEYGFTFGARPWRTAALSLEAGQQKIRGSVNGNVLVPKADERTPLATDPATRAIVERLLSAYPTELPNRTDRNERALNTDAPQVIDTNNAAIRLDQTLSPRDRLGLRYVFTGQAVDAFQLVAGQNPDTDTRAHTARLTWSRTWSAETVTDISAGLDRVASLLVPEPNTVGPSVSIGGVIESLGPDSNLPIDRAQNGFRYAAQIRQVRGAHTWYAGSEIVRQQINSSETSSHRGTLQFRNDFDRDALTNFRLGVPTRYSGAVGDAYRGFRNWNLHLYAGDGWRLTPRFLLSYGVRYQAIPRPSDVRGGNAIPYDCDCNNFAPRFGFTWRLPGQGGLLRGAYGVHFGEIFVATFSQTRFNPPGVTKFEIYRPSLAAVFAGVSPADLQGDPRHTIFDLSPDLVAPYSHQYNLTWEPFDLSNWKLQLGYVGSRTHKLFMMWHTNRARPVPGIEQNTATVNLRRPDPNYYEIRKVLNASHGYFDAARVAVGVPSWRGLSLDASYWLSKAIDLGGNYTTTAAGDDGRQGRSQSEFFILQDLKGPSSFDQSHAFLLRVSYAAPPLPQRWGGARELLRNWNLSAVLLTKTGTPFNVVSGSDAPGFGNVDGSNNDRPHLLDPTILGRTIGQPDTSTARLPRSAFGFIQPYELSGNLGHHVFRKAGIGNVNAALARTWSVGSDKTLTFRAESVNFFNTPQFDGPGSELTSPNFGEITNTLNDGRSFRFLLRFGF